MSDKKVSDLPLGSEDPSENRLWDALATIESEEPSADLRKGFYEKLEQASRPTATDKLRSLLGFSGNAGWITATACLLVGIGTGQMLGTTESSSGDERLVALEENVSMLNRTLILDRLENDSAGKRLQGVLDAAYLAGDDAEIANALLQRATEERVHSVRAAAIDVLGRQISAPSVGKRIMDSIVEAESPLVQLAMIDLVLRNGTQDQLNKLLKLAQDGLLYPDLSRHVLTSLKRDTA
ncbi:MAG: hypothetical protein ACR2QL_10420 [Woeseiaceae bacterium]